MARILVVDDQRGMREMIVESLADSAHVCEAVASAERAEAELSTRDFDLLITDLRLPRASGLDLIRRLREAGDAIPTLLITAHASIEGAVEAMRLGANDYLTKPFAIEELEVRVARALLLARSSIEQDRLRTELRNRAGRMIGDSAAMQPVLKTLRKVAASPVPVLILGESGTGKELLAREIHDRSSCAQGPFVAVNCGAIAPGLIESELFGHERGAFTGAHRRRLGHIELAEGGTLFLDEIGELPIELQVKLLRFLQEKEITRVGAEAAQRVDARVLAASNRDLEAEVQAGRFRQDLYFRLAVVKIELPPLARRREDIPALIDHFVSKWNIELHTGARASADFVQAAMAYDWPGNVRELENAIERAIVLCEGSSLHGEDLPFEPALPADPPVTSGGLAAQVAALEKRLIAGALEGCDGNTSRAAQQLGVKRTTLQYKMRKYGLGT